MSDTLNKDLYYKKTIEYSYKNLNFSFDVANTIFSTFDIDIGTQLLIRTLTTKNNPKSLLDIGCGYGTLGIVLGKLFNIEKITMVDKDMLSIRYAKFNLQKNSVSAEVIPSVGLEQISPFKYDLIVSNIPAKIGDEGIEQDFILKPLEFLSENGEYWFVVVSGLNRLIPEIGKRHNLNMKEITKRNRYAVYRIVKSA